MSDKEPVPCPDCGGTLRGLAKWMIDLWIGCDACGATFVQVLLPGHTEVPTERVRRDSIPDRARRLD